jgi:la-related protein 1
MDSRGWIPISLIASFNRVRRLTTEINLVREVLFLSSMVQVREDWVRMGGWERFVLPDAAESIVPEDHKMMPMEMPVGAAADGGYLFNNRGPFNVEEGGAPFGYGQMPAPQHYRPEGGVHVPTAAYGQGVGGGEQGVEEDEDEDDVEFVMGTNGHSG